MTNNYNFFDDIMLEIKREYTGAERAITEVRYRDSCQWFREDAEARALLDIFSPVAERRVIRQRRVKDVYPDGHTVEGWEA